MNKLAEDKKEVSYEENVITPEEFSELEKKETKKIKLKKAEKPEASAARPEKATDVDMLVLKTEKLEGKIEAMADFRRDIFNNDRSPVPCDQVVYFLPDVIAGPLSPRRLSLSSPRRTRKSRSSMRSSRIWAPSSSSSG